MKDNKVQKVKMAMLGVQRFPWEQGVCMQAVYEQGDVDTAIAMAHDAVLRRDEDGRLAMGGGSVAVTDPAANGEVVWRAYELTGNPMYKEAAEDMLQYLLEKAPRTENGTLCHNTESFHAGYSPNQIWADSIYMAPPFLAVMQKVPEAVKQIQGMYAYLTDPETKLVRHIYDAGTTSFVRDKLWATGNGWALLGIGRVVEIAQQTGFCEEARMLQQLAEDMLENLLQFQLEDGRFHDILDDGDSFVDGASAMMVAAFVYRGYVAGWLSVKYLPNAKLVSDSMDAYVDAYGIIHGVCGCPHFLTEGTSAESMAAYLMMHAWKEKTEEKNRMS